MHYYSLLALLVASLPLACSSDDSDGSDNPQDVQAGSGNSGAAGADGSGTVVTSNLPAAGAEGVAQPSGSPGDIEILDWAGFGSAVSYTFDDANSSQISHYDELQALGVPLTFYLQTGKSTAGNEIWAQALLDGHELGNHTKTHPQSATEATIDDATTFIKETFGVTPYTFAAPYGNSSYVPMAETRFLINRGVSGGAILPNSATNRFNLPCYMPPTGAEASAFNAKVDAARLGGRWQIVLVHGFTGGSDGAYQPVAIEEFVNGVEYAKSFGDVWIDSVVNVGAYWVGQKLVSESTPETTDAGKVWKWTLPANFPPGMVLRLTVSGGTVTQGGRPVAWNGHGYYEIALDAGEVTVSG